jgi:hypothetical protein
MFGAFDLDIPDLAFLLSGFAIYESPDMSSCVMNRKTASNQDICSAGNAILFAHERERFLLLALRGREPLRFARS